MPHSRNRYVSPLWNGVRGFQGGGGTGWSFTSSPLPAERAGSPPPAGVPQQQPQPVLPTPFNPSVQGYNSPGTRYDQFRGQTQQVGRFGQAQPSYLDPVEMEQQRAGGGMQAGGMVGDPLGMAQQLSRYGRTNPYTGRRDSMLMHMNPREVAGLASMGNVTRNPDTGLPEALFVVDDIAMALTAAEIAAAEAALVAAAEAAAVEAAAMAGGTLAAETVAGTAAADAAAAAAAKASADAAIGTAATDVAAAAGDTAITAAADAGTTAAADLALAGAGEAGATDAAAGVATQNIQQQAAGEISKAISHAAGSSTEEQMKKATLDAILEKSGPTLIEGQIPQSQMVGKATNVASTLPINPVSTVSNAEGLAGAFQAGANASAVQGPGVIDAGIGALRDLGGWAVKNPQWSLPAAGGVASLFDRPYEYEEEKYEDTPMADAPPARQQIGDPSTPEEWEMFLSGRERNYFKNAQLGGLVSPGSGVVPMNYGPASALNSVNSVNSSILANPPVAGRFIQRNPGIRMLDQYRNNPMNGYRR